ncbi:MAG: ribonuclease H-like domain-containing protein [Lachnospiraceae bacterium]|nr:ribonuclease H-like domain-containing protein [Lachnospiraceae bacterium]
MKTESIIINDRLIIEDYLNISDRHRVLFIDIETTGLSAHNSYIYMIGSVSYKGDDLIFTSMLAESASEEEQLLKSLIESLKDYDFLIHYNGLTFDLPFIDSRCAVYGLKADICSYKSLDIYKQVSSLKYILNLPKCRQKDIEQYMGIAREDKYSGGELINVYKEYIKTGDAELYKLLFTHNYEDVTGMVRIMPMLSYTALFAGNFTVTGIDYDSYTSYSGKDVKELLIGLKSAFLVPVPFSLNKDGCFLTYKGNAGTLKVPVYNDEFKYFYEDYKDYYYLTKEDMAVHKSVAIYVDKEYRQKAKASNCYTRKSGEFLPEWEPIYAPIFKPEYNSRQMYFEVLSSLSEDTGRLKDYTIHIIRHMQ